MPHGALAVTTDDWNGVPVIRAEGEIDLATVDQFHSAASDAVRPKPASLIFDLRSVRYIDSSGLGVLVAARRSLGDRRECVTVIATEPAVLQALQITGLDRVIRVLREPEGEEVGAASASASRGPKPPLRPRRAQRPR
jgi:anti-anti-sigma factor